MGDARRVIYLLAFLEGQFESHHSETLWKIILGCFITITFCLVCQAYAKSVFWWVYEVTTVVNQIIQHTNIPFLWWGNPESIQIQHVFYPVKQQSHVIHLHHTYQVNHWLFTNGKNSLEMVYTQYWNLRPWGSIPSQPRPLWLDTTLRVNSKQT